MRKMRPLFRVKRSQAGSFPLLFRGLSRELREFCCLVAATLEGSMVLGSGTLTDLGIVTAFHLLGGKKTAEISVTFLKNDNTLLSLETEVIAENKKQDILLLLAPKLSSEFRPVAIGSLLFDAETIVGKTCVLFGCPHGILGINWKAQVLGVSRDAVFTNAFAAPGISGGGVFSREEGGDYLLWAVHSQFFIHSQTLVSRIVRF